MIKESKMKGRLNNNKDSYSESYIMRSFITYSNAIPVQAVVALRVVRHRGSHNLQIFGSQMAAR
jgi:hypothetical protein